MPYVPTNLVIFTAAYAGIHSAMLQAGRVQLSSDPTFYANLSSAAGQWAETVDTLWDNAANPDTLQVFEIQLQSYGLWSGRAALSLTEDECIVQATAMIASITGAEDWFALESIVPPPWPSGSGGSGGTGNGVPLVPPNSPGWVLQSINTTGTTQLPIDFSVWAPFETDAILSFTKNHGTTFEVGFSDVEPTFTASYTATPESATIAYTGAAGSPLNLITPFTSGQILETFTNTVNNTHATFTLQAVFLSGTKTSTLTDTWGLPFLSIINLTGNVVATQAYLDTMRAANGAQAHTSAAGDYLVDAIVGAGQISAIAIPTALDVGVVWTDLIDSLPVSPSFVGTVGGYMNPEGIVISMNLYTVGGVDVGEVSWGLS